ncbi:hypothetical protein JAAARDRAFT_501924 [Jaapia argillacea MUCL 33604]|uniref:Uncharacterized protein n=1 Tax=Jaapia argillacea MUCL 33604 TaxID=933084 RepID=A0A067PMW9_9AGAM|nr:hypothetical protein JAAARDRAFT_501924 [Jaapia argillacea MUCL 33604]
MAPVQLTTKHAMMNFVFTTHLQHPTHPVHHPILPGVPPSPAISETLCSSDMLHPDLGPSPPNPHHSSPILPRR